MNSKEAIEFGKEQLEIFGSDSKMGEFIRIAIKALSKDDYYHLDKLPDAECMVKLEYNFHKCGNCKYLINKDYRYNSGTCYINRIYRRFTDICTHEEEKQ